MAASALGGNEIVRRVELCSTLNVPAPWHRLLGEHHSLPPYRHHRSSTTSNNPRKRVFVLVFEGFDLPFLISTTSAHQLATTTLPQLPKMNIRTLSSFGISILRWLL